MTIVCSFLYTFSRLIFRPNFNCPLIAVRGAVELHDCGVDVAKGKMECSVI